MNAEAHDIRGRAPRITAEDVLAAADALVLNGHRPTIDRVRMHLGRGSPNTINEHLDHWWANLGARLRDLPGQVLPGLPETVTNSLLQLWNLAVRESHQALQASLTTREDALLEVQAQLAQREADLAGRESSWADARAVLERTLDAAQQQNAAMNARNEQLVQTLTQREAALATQHAQAEQLQRQLAALQTQLQRETAARLADRQTFEERTNAAEARALREIDRARQQQKEQLKQATVTEKSLREQLKAHGQTLRAAQEAQRLAEHRLLALQSVADERARQLERLGTSGKAPATPPAAAKRKPRRLSRK